MAPEDKIRKSNKRKTKGDSMDFINGKKSYLIALATILYALFGVLSGNMSFDESIKLVLASGALMSLRHGINKVQK